MNLNKFKIWKKILIPQTSNNRWINILLFFIFIYINIILFSSYVVFYSSLVIKSKKFIKKFYRIL